MDVKDTKTIDSKDSLGGSGSTSSGSSSELALAFYSPPKPERPLLSFTFSTLFLAGDNSGVGLLALPSSLKHSTEYGILLMVLMSSLCTYCGVILGKACTIFAERHHDHYPHYALIGYHTFGRVPFVIIWLTSQITSVGVCTADILQITTALSELSGNCHCYVVILVAAIICPFTFFGTPKDYWWVAYFSLGSTTLAVLLMDLLFIYKIVYTNTNRGNSTVDLYVAHLNVSDSEHKLHGVSDMHLAYIQRGTSAVSIVIFAFAGISLFPTVLIDMENKPRAPYVMVASQVILAVLYLPYAILAYYAYRDDIGDSILENISKEHKVFRYIISILMAIYLFTAFLIHFNHATVEIEHVIGINIEELNWKRILWRTMEMLILLILCLTFPTFGHVVHIMGGSVSTLMTLVFPPLFYIRITQIRNIQNKHWPDRRLPWKRFLFATGTMILGMLVCVVCTIYNIKEFSKDEEGHRRCYDFTKWSQICSESHH